MNETCQDEAGNLIEAGNGNVEGRHGKLAAYWSVKSKAIIAASLLIPLGAVAFFVWYCQSQGDTYALDASVEVGVLQRFALIVHGIYFLCLPILCHLESAGAGSLSLGNGFSAQ